MIIEDCIRRQRHYWDTYTTQPDHKNYMFVTYLNDALYSIADSLGPEYQGPSGWDRFQARLRDYLDGDKEAFSDVAWPNPHQVEQDA